MNAVDLIMELSKLPPELEVVYDASMNEESNIVAFKLVPIDAVNEIISDKGVHYILLYQKSMLPEPLDEEDDDDDR